MPLIIFFAQRSQHAGAQNYLSLIVGLTTLTIIIAAWFGTNLTYKVQPADILCLCVSVFAVVLWLATGKSVIAIIASILAGTYASILTLIHGYCHPEQENVFPFVCGVFSSLITIFTMEAISLQSAAFAVYLCVTNAALVFVMAVLPQISKSQ